MNMAESTPTTKSPAKSPAKPAKCPPGHVAIADIIINKEALRGVDPQNEDFLKIVESVRLHGVLDSISVREIKAADGSIKYGLINGRQRLAAAQYLDKEFIPANITSLDEGDVLEAQIIANACRIETKKAEYAQQVMRILLQNPTLTLRELAGKLCQSTQWLEQLLSLTKLDKNIQTLVDEGKIRLTNAYALAKLPVEEQANFIDRAMTDPPKEFVAAATERARDINKAKRQGKAPQAAGFVPVASLKKISEIKGAMTGGTPTVVCENEGCKTPMDGFVAALKWAFNIDKTGVAAQKAKYEEREAKKKAEKEKRETERAAKKAQEAAEVHVELSDLLGLKTEKTEK